MFEAYTNVHSRWTFCTGKTQPSSIFPPSIMYKSSHLGSNTLQGKWTGLTAHAYLGYQAVPLIWIITERGRVIKIITPTVMLAAIRGTVAPSAAPWCGYNEEVDVWRARSAGCASWGDDQWYVTATNSWTSGQTVSVLTPPTTIPQHWPRSLSSLSLLSCSPSLSKHH